MLYFLLTITACGILLRDFNFTNDFRLMNCNVNYECQKFRKTLTQDYMVGQYSATFIQKKGQHRASYISNL